MSFPHPQSPQRGEGICGGAGKARQARRPRRITVLSQRQIASGPPGPYLEGTKGTAMQLEPRNNADRWIKPAAPEDRPEPGYDEWLAAEIEAGIAELDAGQGVPAADVWRSLGLE